MWKIIHLESLYGAGFTSFSDKCHNFGQSRDRGTKFLIIVEPPNLIPPVGLALGHRKLDSFRITESICNLKKTNNNKTDLKE